jgi:5-methylcytosine-specific restriction endonuclease McrA
MYKTYNCVVCNIESRFKHSKLNLYCSVTCQQTRRTQDIIDNWLDGGDKSVWKYSIPAWAKKYLIEQRGYACEVCDVSEWNGNPLTLQVDHINGDATNNHPTNLQLICPNCHSQTESYAGANRGSGRKNRRKMPL